MTKQNVPVARYVVDVVTKAMSWSYPVCVQVEEPGRQMSTVEPVTGCQGGQCESSYDEWGHRYGPTHSLVTR